MSVPNERVLCVASARHICIEAGVDSLYVQDVIRDFGRDIDRTGATSVSDTTLEATGDGLRYRVVDGDRLRRHAPRVADLYGGALLREVAQLTRSEVVTQQDTRGALSLNELPPDDGRYERHLDDSSFTAIVYFTTRQANEGGALELEGPAEPQLIRIVPVEYLLVVFTGTAWPHQVSQTQSLQPRRCLVANYWFAEVPQIRPTSLDSYLYGPPETRANASHPRSRPSEGSDTMGQLGQVVQSKRESADKPR